ncbi:MAG: ABC transporter ATP-binding protein [Chloroflexota bacterium]
MPVLEMQGITKRFGPLLANDQIDLTVEPNEIHALLGENGAGKTTLMKILYGLYQPDAGSILIDNRPVRFRSPASAIAHGIGYVSQHFSLVPTLTVAENIVLGYEGRSLLQRREMEQIVHETAQRFGFNNIPPDALVRDLSVGQQQRVEILKALYRDCRVLILDEPTAVLTPQDAANLFETLLDLRARHLSVIMITHKLEEVMAISQQVTVLRHGRVVGRRRTSETNPTDLANLMVGRSTAAVTRKANHQASTASALNVRDLWLQDRRGVALLRGVSLTVNQGEIVGVAGVAGNGQSELVGVLSGMIAPDRGTVEVRGNALKLGDPRAFNRARVGRIPEDRLKGVVSDLTVAQNLALEQMEDFSRAGHVDYKRIEQHAERLIREFQIKARPGDRARTLSGGNIQKIILARALARDPVVVIAAQPTRGLDIGATEYVHQKLLEQKERGAGVLLVSEDLDELLMLSDRIVVMFKGEITGRLDATTATPETIGLLMAGGQQDRQANAISAQPLSGRDHAGLPT